MRALIDTTRAPSGRFYIRGMSMKFGDIVVNGWASENNPHRIGIFVRNKGKTIQLTDGKGHFWETYNDKESKLIVMGSMLLPDGSLHLK